MMSVITKLILVLGLIVVVNSPQAALIDRGGGLIYDTTLNITWLQNANYGAGSVYDDASTGTTTDGFMIWQNASGWAANLSYYDSVRNVTYDDWRLPATDESCGFGFNCTTSEMGHLYYVDFGGVAGGSMTNSTNLALFQNIQPYGYWSTIYPGGVDTAWLFYFHGTFTQNGWQDVGPTGNGLSAWAVRDGDVAAVPVPGAVWLFGSGLIGLMGLVRRKKR